ncbi:MAG: phage integrase N-terminal SAM-like domain-containing protein [Verrucomicrobiota bacterium]
MEKAKAELSHRVTVAREGFIPNPKRKLLDDVRDVVRLKHHSLRTEQTYVDWIKQHTIFHDMLHPREMGAEIGQS